MIDLGRFQLFGKNPVYVSAFFFNLAADKKSLEWMISVHPTRHTGTHQNGNFEKNIDRTGTIARVRERRFRVFFFLVIFHPFALSLPPMCSPLSFTI